MRPPDETIRLMTAKLHRVRVTSTHKDYVGSVTIDRDLLDAVGILPLEEVEIVNVSNGQRWSTYALPGPSGSGQVSPNGGGAFLCEPGEILIIFAYAWRTRAEVLEKGHTARVFVSGENNARVDLLDQSIRFDADGGAGLAVRTIAEMSA